jgi:hypothetical protein
VLSIPAPGIFPVAKEVFKVWGTLRGVDDENRRRSSGKVQAVYSVTNKKIECFRCGGNHMARKCRLGFEDVT